MHWRRLCSPPHDETHYVIIIEITSNYACSRKHRGQNKKYYEGGVLFEKVERPFYRIDYFQLGHCPDLQS